MDILYSNIPEKMKQIPHWICYDEMKRPMNPRTGGLASPTDPTTWADFTTAITAQVERKFTGIGFVFTEDIGFVGIDYDKIIDDNGIIFPQYINEIDAIKSYKEISPSGRGIHAILVGKKPHGACRKGNIEMYEKDRYFTVTGHKIPSSTVDVENDPESINFIFEKYLKTNAWESKTSPTSVRLVLSNDEIIQKLRKSKSKKKFEALWSGDPIQYGPLLGEDKSASAADLSLADIIAFYTDSPDQILQIMETSGLRRDKWYERHGEEFYIITTIRKATNECKARFKTKDEEAQERIQVVEEVPSDEEIWKAEEILKQDPIKFILSTFHEDHVGDDIPAYCYMLSLASQSILNSGGLHVMSTGSSGKGKSHAADTMLKQIPMQHKSLGSISDKTLFYHHFNPMTVFKIDDRDLSQELNSIIKDATTHFQCGIDHKTIVKGEPKVFRSPDRSVWWIVKVEGTGDDQMWNRMLCPYIDESEETDQKVISLILDRASKFSQDTIGESINVKVAKALWYLLRKSLVAIEIPYATSIKFQRDRNRRNPEIFIDMIRSITLINRYKRSTRMEGEIMVVISDLEDYKITKEIFDKITREVGGQVTKLTLNERVILDIIISENLREFTLNNLISKLHSKGHKEFSYTSIRRIFNGRPDRDFQGLLEKCPFVKIIDTSIMESSIDTKTTRKEAVFKVNIEDLSIWLMGLSVSISTQMHVVPPA